MRFFELVSGLRVPLSNEEQRLLVKSEEDGSVARATLDDREQEVARQMTARGILRRVQRDEKTHFVPNADPNLRRF